MREIKFRAWDKRSHSYVLPIGHFVEFDGEIWFNDSDMNGDRLYSQGDNLILEQYTGLKDRNGVEIYEGDVVKAIGIATMRNVAPVIFKRGQFGMEYDLLWDLGGFNEQDIEVIGNVHEHAHLLDS